MKADMHIHTNASDGLQTPEEVVKRAAEAGLGAISVTDHDTVFSVAETGELCARYGIKLIPGVEISAYLNYLKIHILGYGFDAENPDFRRFMSWLAEGSEQRACRMLERLKSNNNIILDISEVFAERIAEDVPVHAMHIARVAAKHGFAQTPFEFYGNYLMPGKPAFSLKGRPTPWMAINAITEAGGIAVLAHPGRINLNKRSLKNMIKRLAGKGLQGIEAVYSTHTYDETAYFKEIAEAYGLYVTGGSDCHFSGGDKKIGEPVFLPSEGLLQRLKI